MDRQKSMETLRKLELTSVLGKVMDILEPGERIKWGEKSYPDLVGLVACQLALEYEVLTGAPIVEMLDAAGATTVPAVEMPAKPAAIETSPTVPIAAPAPSDDALPLS